jgi:hypothetical protein
MAHQFFLPQKVKLTLRCKFLILFGGPTAKNHAGVAELADAPDLGSGGQPWGFKSLHPHHSSTGRFANHGKPFIMSSCGRSSIGRASPCQGEGRGFETRRPLQIPCHWVSHPFRVHPRGSSKEQRSGTWIWLRNADIRRSFASTKRDPSSAPDRFTSMNLCP